MYYDRRTQRAARRAYRRSMRGRGGIYGFPWFILVLLIIFSHTFWAIVGGVVVAVLLTVFLLRIFGTQGMMGNAQQPQQPPYYQPSQQPYQQPPESSYQSYQQGYQPPPQEIYQEGGQPHPYPQQHDPYQQYEQPQAQYPEEMPPMQQQ